jgi:hypothetical protein
MLAGAIGAGALGGAVILFLLALHFTREQKPDI